MKNILLLLAFITLATVGMAQKNQDAESRAEVTIQTTQGKIVVALSNETPLHRDNFLAQVRRGYYDGLLFHRIIASFMIQCGDSTSRDVKAQEFTNARGDDPYRIPAEIRFRSCSIVAVLWQQPVRATISTLNARVRPTSSTSFGANISDHVRCRPNRKR